ncbi:MAG: hypothetical protein ACJ71N_01860 [Terriglobales bacterium]
MKRSLLLTIGAGAVAVAAAAAMLLQIAAAPATPVRPLAQVTPSGALLFIKAKDFGALLKDWNASPEKQSWLKSDDYEVFSRSKLFLRLKHDQAEFAKAAGFPLDMAMVGQVGGSESAFAVYDIGKLEFLYVTRMPQAHAAETILWKKRGDYQPRKVGNSDYYVRVEPESQRTVAFAVSGDYLLVATREDLLAQSLSLLNSSGGKAVAGEGWYTKSIAAAAEPGDLRMVLNLEAIVATPQFNSYWIQENVGELKTRYSSEVSDLFRTADEYREQRVLLLKGDDQEKAGGKNVANPEFESAVGQLLRLVPVNQSFFQSWAKPSVDDLLTAVSTQILSPHFGSRPASKVAPGASATSGSAGSESDLETRIDAPQRAPMKEGDSPLKILFSSAEPMAVLKLKSTQQTEDGVFVQPRSTVAIIAKNPWNPDEIREVLQKSIENMTTARLGVTWTPRKQGTTTYYELDGLSPVSVFTNKNLLVISNSPQSMQLLLSSTRATSSGAWYAAGFEHARERSNFIKMTRPIENTGVDAGFGENPEHGNNSNGQPKFFSDNIGSLSQTLKRVQTETIEVHNFGDRETQTVRYKWVQ